MSDKNISTTHPTFREVPRTGVIYVMAKAAERGFHYGAEGWANLGQGAPETGPLPDSPARIDGISIDLQTHEYSPVMGLRALREAVAAMYNRRYRQGMASQYTAENVAIAGGGRLGLSRLAAALGKTHLGHFLPDYTAYEELLETFSHFTPIPIPLGPERGYGFAASELEAEIVARGLGAVLLSNPSNPTGALIAGQQLADWVGVSRRTDCFLLLDEFYSNYIWDPGSSPHGSVSAAAYVEDVDTDPVVILDGITKNWRYPGWRVGWTVGPREVIEAVSSVGSFLDGGASHPMQRAALTLLDESVAEVEAKAIRAAFAPKRDMMLQRLMAMGVRIDAAPRGAFYVWGSVEGLPDGINTGMDFFQAALERKVITVPGEFFDVNPGKRRQNRESRFSRYLRFSFGPTAATLDAGLGRLAQMVGDYASR